MGTATAQAWSTRDLEARVVRYADLKPCLNAFIDTRTPGSSEKENFTIIGPGVSENADQHVHIAEPHGFNIGGARQPPECTNSQHSHDTAEVFVVHSGQWRFDFGEHGDDAQLAAGPGDVVSFPTRAFRGFRNVGTETGFLWSVLGGDDPGRVTWAPQVFAMARDYGLQLLENGALIDTAAGQTAAGVAPMPVTSRATIEALRVMRPADEAEVLARAPADAEGGEVVVIGPGGTLPPADGFTLSRLTLAGGVADMVARDAAEVIFVHRGTVRVRTPDAEVTLGEGDTMTVPPGLPRAYAGEATAFVVRGTA